MTSTQSEESTEIESASPSSKLKDTATSPSPEEPIESTTSSTAWQAIFAPQYNTYYFYNALTQETTWINPLQQPQPQPEASTSTSSSATTTPTVETEAKTELDPNNAQVGNGNEEDTSAQWTSATTAASARYAALQAAALAQGIDPLLAHLDPSLSASPSVPGGSGGTSGVLVHSSLSNAH